MVGLTLSGEGALGLGTLTHNDGYAQPTNDIFALGPTAITFAPGGRSVVLGTYDDSVRLHDTRLRTTSRAMRVGALLVVVAITR